MKNMTFLQLDKISGGQILAVDLVADRIGVSTNIIAFEPPPRKARAVVGIIRQPLVTKPPLIHRF